MIQQKSFILLLFIMITLFSVAPAELHGKMPVKNTSAKDNRSIPNGQLAQVLDVKHWSNPDYTRVVISMNRDAVWQSHELDRKTARAPGRIFIDIQHAKLGAAVKDITIGDGLLKGVRTAVYKPGVVRIVLDTENIRDYKVFPLSNPSKLVIDVMGDRRTEISRIESSLSSRVNGSINSNMDNRDEQITLPSKSELKTEKITKPDRKHASISKIRRIVLDPGHGGHDPGAVGQSGLQEKDVVLSISLKLREKLKEELGVDVVMTRSTDVFIPLEERTAIANKVNGDLFVSIHANAAVNRNASGIETYYLNLAKTEKVAQLAAKENGTSLENVSTLQAILFDLMANYKLNDSAHLAEEVQKAVYKTVRTKYPDTRNLGVKQGPFYVLVGATMPSILVETAFISNSTEETHLRDSSFHETAADGILKGIRNYISTQK